MAAVEIQTVTLNVAGQNVTVNTDKPPQFPKPTTKPPGTEYGPETPGRFGRVWNDLHLLGASRTTFGYPSGIQFTNMIEPASELYYNDDGVLKIKGKPRVSILETDWWTYLAELMGEYVRGKFQVDGYGFMDTGPTALYCLFMGGNLVHEVRQHYQNGWWSMLSCQDYGKPIDRSISWYTHPHLFHKQNVVFSTKRRAYGECVDKGLVGGMGDVIFPVVAANKVRSFTDVPLVGLERNKIAFYPRPPFDVTLYAESLVIDGVWKDPSTLTGTPVTVSRLCFYGSNVYGQIGEEWYTLSEMLVRGNPAQPGLAGSIDDYRVYVSPWDYPPGVGVIGWTNRHLPEDYPWR